MSTTTRWTAIAMCLLLCGCGDRSRDEEKEGVFDPMISTIDKAEEVQDIGLEHKDQLDEALKEAEGLGAEERDQ